jgi:hypothetical protein
MARSANLVKSEELILTVNTQTTWYLDRLIESGLYGNTRNEAARTALFDHCKLLVAEGKLEMAPAIASSQAIEIANE